MNGVVGVVGGGDSRYEVVDRGHARGDRVAVREQLNWCKAREGEQVGLPLHPQVGVPAAW